jgi:flagellar basal body P-ring formation protein FlgA
MRRLSSLAAIAATTALCVLSGLAGARAEEIVYVPNRTIYVGEEVTMASMREVVLRPGKVIPGDVAYRPQDFEGKVAKRTLLPSRYVALGSLRDAYLVEQGTPVQVSYEAGSLLITATAICLQSGGAGDMVRVRNPDSGKVFSGVVLANGTIRVGT